MPGSVVVEAWPESVLPLLRKRAGLFHWRVADYVETTDGGAEAPRDSIASSATGATSARGVEGGDAENSVDVCLRWHNSFAKAQQQGMAHAVPSLWPPSESEARAWQLTRCSRFLPHDQVRKE